MDDIKLINRPSKKLIKIPRRNYFFIKKSIAKFSNKEICAELSTILLIQRIL